MHHPPSPDLLHSLDKHTVNGSRVNTSEMNSEQCVSICLTGGGCRVGGSESSVRDGDIGDKVDKQ